MKKFITKDCKGCGKELSIKAEICPNCGEGRNIDFLNKRYQNGNRWLITLTLCWFLGPFGAHRFYTGKIKTGAIQFGATITSFICVVLSMALVLSKLKIITEIFLFLGLFIEIACLIWVFIDFIKIILGQYADNEGIPVRF